MTSTVSLGDKSTSVGVIGLGYVGLPLCLAFARNGVVALGVDVDAAKVEQLARGESYIKHVAAADVQAARQAGCFDATTDFARLREVSAILICVPTPLTANRVPDLSFVESTASAIAPHLKAGQLVVLESTTYPGTTEDVVRPILEKGSGLVAGVLRLLTLAATIIWAASGLFRIAVPAGP
jgi:UDP-N-acetyl-D-glucosamine dehydrogenase